MNTLVLHFRTYKTPLQWLGGAVALLVALAVVLSIWKAECIELAVLFVDTFHGPGVAAGFFFPDAIPIPVPHDLFSTAGLVGGLSFWTVVCWAHLGSMCGGSVGFSIGRRLQHTLWFKRIMEGRGAQADEIVRKYGDFGVFVGAFTPLPYSLVCWAAGALGMGWGRFLLVSQVRFFRIAIYLWAIDNGLLQTIILPQ